MKKSGLSQVQAAARVEKLAREGRLGFNTYQNVSSQRLPNGDIVIDACSERGFRNDTRGRITIKQSYSDVGSEIYFNKHPRNTAESSKISGMESNCNDHWLD